MAVVVLPPRRDHRRSPPHPRQRAERVPLATARLRGADAAAVVLWRRRDHRLSSPRLRWCAGVAECAWTASRVSSLYGAGITGLLLLGRGGVLGATVSFSAVVRVGPVGRVPGSAGSGRVPGPAGPDQGRVSVGTGRVRAPAVWAPAAVRAGPVRGTGQAARVQGAAARGPGTGRAPGRWAGPAAPGAAPGPVWGAAPAAASEAASRPCRSRTRDAPALAPIRVRWATVCASAPGQGRMGP
ncbi:hypothetical protein BZB76_5831 [Actinomadura pelletieri DSM 43383]|uniref:Uncharacterized protein n=1 Tax=Actinomadura pelletieri DSM 43383 TaxID=1120940 RepID=A0A495QB44_9ACTN|nr:hypothetical protein BZB76_5831 [Actinomadura pelletieri DSM 43383]